MLAPSEQRFPLLGLTTKPSVGFRVWSGHQALHPRWTYGLDKMELLFYTYSARGRSTPSTPETKGEGSEHSDEGDGRKVRLA